MCYIVEYSLDVVDFFIFILETHELLLMSLSHQDPKKLYMLTFRVNDIGSSLVIAAGLFTLWRERLKAVP